MNRRRLLKVFTAAALFSAASLVSGQAQRPAYATLNPPQAGGANGQIEVIEFFSYGCPHCYNFDPLLSKWRAAQKKDITFVHVPVSFGRPDWAALGRLYVTLKAMGLDEKLHAAVFDAYQKDRVKLDDEKVRNEWLAKQGVDVRKFNDTWRSFGVDTQTKRAEQLSAAYRIQGVPSLAINGKYLIDGEGEQTLKTADELLQRVRAGK